MFSENGLSAPVPSVNACRPAYPGYNNAAINALAFLIHDIEDQRTVISNDDDALMIGVPGSDNGIMGNDWMSKGTDQVSVHFGVSPDYTAFCLSLNLGAWGAGPNANGFCIQAEQSGVAAFDFATWTSDAGMRQLHRMATLYAEVCHLYGWQAHWATDQEIQACAGGSGAFGVGGALYHSDITRNFPGDTTHTDPGDNYPGKPSGPYVIGNSHPNDLFMPLALSIFNGTPTTKDGFLMTLSDADQQILFDNIAWLRNQFQPGEDAFAGLQQPSIGHGLAATYDHTNQLINLQHQDHA